MSQTDESAQIAALNKVILRSIVDHAVVTLDANGIITSWNEGAERILGWSEEEIVGQSADLFFTDEDTERNRAETEMRLALEEGRAEDVRWHVRKDGVKFWGSGLMMPLLKETDVGGDAVQNPAKIDGFVKIFRDRTAEREASRRIAKLQDRARLAMRRSGTVGVFDNDLKRDIIVGDETCARLHSVDVDLSEQGARVADFMKGIVEEDRPKAQRALDAAVDEGLDVDVTYRVSTEGPKPTWIQSQGTVQFGEDGKPERLIGIVVDVTEQREHLRMQEARLEFADHVRDITDRVEIAKLASRVIAETIYADRVGHGLVGDDGDTIFVEADWNGPRSVSVTGRHTLSDFGRYAETLRQGHDVIIDDAANDARVDRPDLLAELGVGSLVNLPLMEHGKLKAVMFVNDASVRHWTEAEITFLGAMFDRTYAAIDRMRFETERDALTEELAHRMKNVLTMAQIVVKQSLRGVKGVEHQKRAIEARFMALASAQDVLTRSQEKDADIRSVIDTTLAPHIPDRSRISITGPSCALDSQQVIGLTLALHELATNAAKYGAFSNDVGTVAIDWQNDGGRFRFQWIESGGPKVAAPENEGFGSIILQRISGSYFDGQSVLRFDEGGVRFTIEKA
ncbi:PAS domain S-box protein [Maribius pontilimi]|uniref:histidine kinase n=1 Tax=Palleronia pontilimi TaxID=1964209 RepID=A0A934MD68_9RHOB|nr:HWE histidine kinase domain-containing protein [Palleronia pontilimi]MBJ3762031.1 PAS domain S-box protein [Palleronia pontilimi]